MRRAGLPMVAILAVTSAMAQTAVLECTADTVVGGIPREKILQINPSSRALLDFRFSAVGGWQIREARLMLHVAEGAPPAKIEVAVILGNWSESDVHAPPRIGRSQTLSVSIHEEGWISITVPPALLQPSVGRRAHGIAIRGGSQTIRLHSRESLSWAPYLIAAGTPPVRQAQAGTSPPAEVSIATTDRPVW